jgi:hypothetical protein
VIDRLVKPGNVCLNYVRFLHTQRALFELFPPLLSVYLPRPKNDIIGQKILSEPWPEQINHGLIDDPIRQGQQSGGARREAGFRDLNERRLIWFIVVVFYLFAQMLYESLSNLASNLIIFARRE